VFLKRHEIVLPQSVNPIQQNPKVAYSTFLVSTLFVGINRHILMTKNNDKKGILLDISGCKVMQMKLTY
jgi:hypothetical protein